MKLLVIGSKGSIGSRRMMLLQEMGNKVVGFDAKDNQYFYPEAAKDFDAVFLCVPPSKSVALALDCVTARTPFFLEKPGAISFREFLPLVAAVQKLDLVNMVSCNLRFTTEYKAIQEAITNIGKPVFAYAEFGYFLPFWRDGQYRTYYSCYRMAGGGILMDAIHELDYMFSLFGVPSEINRRFCVVTHENTKELHDLDAEDTANVFVVYKNGLAITIHVDYLQRSYKRVFHAIGSKGRIDQTFNVQGSNTMYKREMQHFLDCVKKSEPTVKSVEEHSKLLEFIDTVRQPVK